MPRPRNLAMYDQPCRVVTDEEAAALNRKWAEERAARHANGPLARVRALKPGESHVFTQYQLTSQLSPTIQSAKRTGGQYSRSRELSLVDGACVGVRVTRTG